MIETEAQYIDGMKELTALREKYLAQTFNQQLFDTETAKNIFKLTSDLKQYEYSRYEKKISSTNAN